MRGWRLWTAALVLGLLLWPLPSVQAAGPQEVWVDDGYCSSCPNDGHQWGSDAFSTISEGLLAVEKGGTVHVLPGRYQEDVRITKSCQVLAQGESPIILASLKGSVALTVAANDVTISGLEIVGSRQAAILVVGPDFQREAIRGVVLRDNVIHGGQYGIAVNIDEQRTYGDLRAIGVEIRNNRVAGCKRAIYVYNTAATIVGNSISAIEQGGIGIYSSRDSVSQIRNNTVNVDAPEGRAVYVLDNQGTSIEGNTLVGVSDYLTPTTGIALYGYRNLRLMNNTVEGFYWGTTVYTGGTARVAGNTFAGPMAWALSFGSAITTTQVTIEDNVIRDAYWGLRLDNDGGYGLQAVVRGNAFHDNVIGIQLEASLGEKSLELQGNSLCGNLIAGLRNVGVQAVDIRYNWWGANDGPRPLGKGDRVEGIGVARSKPWLQLLVRSQEMANGQRLMTATLGGDRNVPYLPHAQDITFTTNRGTFAETNTAVYTTHTDQLGEAQATLALPAGEKATVTVSAGCGESVSLNLP